MLRLFVPALLLAAAAPPALAAAPSGMVAAPAPAVHAGPGAGGFHPMPRYGRWNRYGTGRHRDRDRPSPGYDRAYSAGIGIEAYDPAREQGFFRDGDAVRTPGGVAYDYDRGYPYDHYREPPPLRRAEAPAEPVCTIERVRGPEGPGEVRICRR